MPKRELRWALYKLLLLSLLLLFIYLFYLFIFFGGEGAIDVYITKVLYVNLWKNKVHFVQIWIEKFLSKIEHMSVESSL
jgi:hypothetical protein